MNLELVSRDALIDELARRYPNMVIGLHAPLTTETSNRLCWYQGEPLILLGLATMLEHEMVRRVKEEEQIDPEQTGDV